MANKVGSQKVRTQPSVTMVLGDELEYRVARFFSNQGYFTRRSRLIHTTGYLNQATDVDVLAIRYLGGLHRELIIAECKSGSKSNDSAPLDRIFWLIGLKNYTKASHAYFIRRPTKWDIKSFAKENGVEILDLDRLSEMENTYGISPSHWPGYTDRQFFSQRITGWNSELKKDRYLADVYFTLNNEIRFLRPFSAINILAFHLQSLTKTYVADPTGIRGGLVRYLMADATSQMGLYLFEVASLNLGLSPRDREGFIRKRLTYGDTNSRFADKVLKNAYMLAQQTASHYAQTEISLPQELFEFTAPDYTRDMIDFVNAIINIEPVAPQFLNVCDIFLAESFVKESPELPSVDEISSLVLDLATSYFATLTSLNLLPQTIFDQWKDRVLNVPAPPTEPEGIVSTLQNPGSTTPSAPDLSDDGGDSVDA